jgi:hypothetical protein
MWRRLSTSYTSPGFFNEYVANFGVRRQQLFDCKRE